MQENIINSISILPKLFTSFKSKRSNKTNLNKGTSNNVLELGRAKYGYAWKEFEGVDEPVVVGVPNDEVIFVDIENFWKMLQIEGKWLADGFERGHGVA